MNKKHKLVAKKHRKNKERLKEIRKLSLAKRASKERHSKLLTLASNLIHVDSKVVIWNCE